MTYEKPTPPLNQVVRLVADPYPPYQFEDEGLVKGADYEIVARSLAVSAIRTTIKLLPWDACLDAMRCGEADAIFQITPTPEREQEFLFSKPFRAARTLFFKRADTVLAEGADNEVSCVLAAHTLGVLRGFSYGAIVDEAPAARTAVARQEQLIEGLAERRFQLALLDQGVAEYLARRMEVTDIEPVPGLEIRRKLHLAARRDLQPIVKAFETGLSELSTSGEYDDILERYGVGVASGAEANA